MMVNFKSSIFGISILGVAFSFALPMSGQSQPMAPGPPGSPFQGTPGGSPDYASQFVSDVTIPDGTQVKAGESFVKTWRILNSGSKEWVDLEFAFLDGSQMGAPAAVKVPTTPPGKTVDISVPMTAPAKSGPHRGSWQMRAPEGELFGQSVFVLIMVKEEISPELVKRLGPRPILYLDVDGKETVISGVSSKGDQRAGLVRSRERGCLSCLKSSMGIWSPKGDWFAYLALDLKTENPSLFLQNLKGEVKPIAVPENISGPVAWSPDGQRIALMGGEGLVIVHVGKETIMSHSLDDVQGLGGRSGTMGHPAKFRWSPNGKKILLSWGGAIVVDAETGEIETIVNHHVFPEWGAGSDGVYFFDIISEDEGKKKRQKWGGLYFQKLGGNKPRLLLDEAGLSKNFGLDEGDITSSDLWPGFFKLSPKGAWLSVLTRKAENQKSYLYLLPLSGGKMPSFGKPPRRIEIEDIVVGLQWSPTEKGLAGIGAAGALGVKVLDLETEDWITLALITPNETVSAIYGFGFKGMSWTD